MEHESYSQLPFLDILVLEEGGRLHTSVNRKLSFSGLGTSFFSFIFRSVKLFATSSAVFRAYHVSSTYSSFHYELQFIKRFFADNGFPIKIVDSFIHRFLDSKYTGTMKSVDVPKLEKYFVLPYFGVESENLKRDITNLLSKFYPFLNAKIVLVSSFSFGSFFRY